MYWLFYTDCDYNKYNSCFFERYLVDNFVKLYKDRWVSWCVKDENMNILYSGKNNSN